MTKSQLDLLQVIFESPHGHSNRDELRFLYGSSYGKKVAELIRLGLAYWSQPPARGKPEELWLTEEGLMVATASNRQMKVNQEAN